MPLLDNFTPHKRSIYIQEHFIDTFTYVQILTDPIDADYTDITKHLKMSYEHNNDTCDQLNVSLRTK